MVCHSLNLKSGPKPKALVIMDYFLPGFRAGGPIRSVFNLIDWLGEELSFYILTSNHDLGDRKSYPGLHAGTWHKVGSACVRYLECAETGILSMYRILKTVGFDIIYLNSFFSRLSIKVLILRKVGLIPHCPIILAPRGEFSRGALSIKWLKKRVYIVLSLLLSFYDGILWQASSEYEKQDIFHVLRRYQGGGIPSVLIASNLTADQRVEVASDLPPRSRGSNLPSRVRPVKRSNCGCIVFLSRISRIKNLKGALSIILNLNAPLVFDIYGPVEDEDYWKECQGLIAKMPGNIQVSYRGPVRPEAVTSVLSRYHLFLLPTMGENFGHVILEALGAGCLVLTSDQVPWLDLETKGVGWNIALSDKAGFLRILGTFLAMDQPEFEEACQRAIRYTRDFALDEGLVESNRRIFMRALNGDS